MHNASEYSHDSIRCELDKLGLHNVKLSFFEEIGSTNSEMKKAYLSSSIEAVPQIFVARQQSAGRGRLGRSFISPNAGIYMSLLFPKAFGGAKLTAYVAVMLAEAIEEISGVSVDIKWVNDIYASGRKLSGILCEGLVSAESLCLEASVIGIGVNVFKTEFPREISDIAVSLEELCGKKISRAELVGAITEKIFKKLPGCSETKLIEKYKSKSNVLGKMLKVICADESFFAKALDINENAELTVLKDTGELVTLNSGEVSIKFN